MSQSFYPKTVPPLCVRGSFSQRQADVGRSTPSGRSLHLPHLGTTWCCLGSASAAHSCLAALPRLESQEESHQIEPGLTEQKPMASLLGDCLCSRNYAYWPGGSDGKESVYNGTPGFNPWVRKIPWRREWQPTPAFLLGKFHGKNLSLAGYRPWGRQESDMTEQSRLLTFMLTDIQPAFTSFPSHFPGSFLPLFLSVKMCQSTRLVLGQVPSKWVFCVVQGAVAARVQEGLEELSHVEGQEGWWWGDIPRPR